jgi:hypothetical protein
MSASGVDDFVTKLAMDQYYIDPKAFDDPNQAGILRELTAALIRYRLQSMASVVQSPHVVRDIISLIAIARSAGVVRTKGGGGESSLKRQSDKPGEEEIMLQLLKLIQKLSYSQGPTYNIEGDVGKITTIYANTVKEIEDAPNIPKEGKSRLKRFLENVKEKGPSLIPLTAALLKEALSSLGLI